MVRCKAALIAARLFGTQERLEARPKRCSARCATSARRRCWNPGRLRLIARPRTDKNKM
jgi:hypothetical protein